MVLVSAASCGFEDIIETLGGFALIASFHGLLREVGYGEGFTSAVVT